jgi:hypothetical protein
MFSELFKTMRSILITPGFCLFFIFLLTAGSTESVYCQTDTLSNKKQYVFPEFTKSKVLMKSGKDIFMALNYNIITEKLVFLQKGEIYDILNPELVDTAYIQNHKFIRSENLFLELLLNSKVPLLVQYTGKIRAAPKPAPYGGTTDIPSSTYVTSIQRGNDMYKLKNDPNMIIVPEKVYWLNINGSPVKFQSEAQLLKILPDHKSETKLYIKQNKLKFKNTDDVISLISFYNSLIK